MPGFSDPPPPPILVFFAGLVGYTLVGTTGWPPDYQTNSGTPFQPSISYELHCPNKSIKLLQSWGEQRAQEQPCSSRRGLEEHGCFSPPHGTGKFKSTWADGPSSQKASWPASLRPDTVRVNDAVVLGPWSSVLCRSLLSLGEDWTKGGRRAQGGAT